MQEIKFEYRPLLLALVIFLMVISCTTEEDTFEYVVITKNATSTNLELSLYDAGNLFESNVIPANASTECSYRLPSFQGFAGCDNSNRLLVDSIIIRFDNGKGYICALTGRESSNVDCFPGKFLFGRDEATFKELSSTEFEFEITQDDFENAFDLPE